MNTQNLNTQDLNTQAFIKTVNDLRLANKNSWYTWQGIVNGKNVQLKGFKTWLQVFYVDSLQCGNCSDKSVKEFKQDLFNAVN